MQLKTSNIHIGASPHTYVVLFVETTPTNQIIVALISDLRTISHTHEGNPSKVSDMSVWRLLSITYLFDIQSAQHENQPSQEQNKRKKKRIGPDVHQHNHWCVPLELRSRSSCGSWRDWDQHPRGVAFHSLKVSFCSIPVSDHLHSLFARRSETGKNRTYARTCTSLVTCFHTQVWLRGNKQPISTDRNQAYWEL